MNSININNIDVNDNYITTDDSGNDLNQNDYLLLNMEVTPEIEAALVNYVYARSIEEHTKFTKARAANKSVDNERLLNIVVDIQEQMATIMKAIHQLEPGRKAKLADLDSWVKRFNKWKDSPAYFEVTSQVRSRAWDVYKAQLSIKKAVYNAAKDEVSSLWTSWNTLKVECEEFIGNRTYLWGHYFNLVEETINTYNTNGDTEEVDSQAQLYPTVNQAVDYVRDEHIAEQAEYKKPEARGRGYWNYSNEAKVKYSNDYINSLLADKS